MSSRVRNVMFTSFEDGVYLNPDYYNYFIVQREKCPKTGKLHYQGYVELKKQMMLNSVKKYVFMSKTIHLEKRNGTQIQAINYCSKEETRYSNPIIEGVLKCQGKRNDLVDLYHDIKNGMSTSNVLQNYPKEFIKYGRGIKQVQFELNKIKSKQFRKVETIVLYGPAGCGKTRHVYDMYGYDKVYKLDSGNGVWFDGYEGEDVLLVDDFYGWLKYGFLLNLLDGYPLRLDIKGGHTWANFTKIYITSNVSPSLWYKDGLTPALRRRLTEIRNLN